jgi:hypothetical protein
MVLSVSYTNFFSGYSMSNVRYQMMSIVPHDAVVSISIIISGSMRP